MEPADSIARLGFIRWYERRLIEGHAWLITGIISIITVGACMEELTFKGSVLRGLVYVVVLTATAAIGGYGFLRYQKILVEAERLGEQATCASCGTYARFRIVSGWNARCRKCQHEWRLVPED